MLQNSIVKVSNGRLELFCQNLGDPLRKTRGTREKEEISRRLVDYLLAAHVFGYIGLAAVYTRLLFNRFHSDVRVRVSLSCCRTHLCNICQNRQLRVPSACMKDSLLGDGFFLRASLTSDRS